MHSRSVARATLAVVAGGGLGALASAAALGMESPYFKVAIVGGVDAITIGLAGLTAPPASPTSLHRPRLQETSDFVRRCRFAVVLSGQCTSLPVVEKPLRILLPQAGRTKPITVQTLGDPRSFLGAARSMKASPCRLIRFIAAY